MRQEENKENNEDFDKIKVFSSEDEKLKLLGELLSNKSSRDIIKLLSKKEMYTNEIAKKLDIRANLVIHHLKKLEELGLLEITHKKIVKKGSNHRYFKMIPNLFIISNHEKKEINKNGFLKKFFKKSIKFATIGLAGVIVWITIKPENMMLLEPISKPDPIDEGMPSDSMPLDIEIYPVPFSEISVKSIESMIVSIIISASVILIGIILERMLSKWWKKRK